MKKMAPLTLLTLIALLFLAAPVLASGLQVNGQSCPISGNILIRDGTARVSVDFVERALGATVVIEGDQVTITKGTHTLTMRAGSALATLDEQRLAAPMAPFRTPQAQIMLPLRFLGECLDIEVGYRPADDTIVLSFPDARNGMTAGELLGRANAKTMQYNSYHVSGKMIISMYIEGLKPPRQSFAICLIADQNGYIQNKPYVYYLKNDIRTSLPIAMLTGDPVIEVESLFKDNNSYYRWLGGEWVISSDENTANMFMPNDNDPVKMIKDLQDSGFLACFGEDEVIDGRACYTVNINLMDQNFGQQLKQMMQGTQTLPAEQAKYMEQVLQNFNADMFIKAYIDRSTLLNEYTDIKSSFSTTLPDPETGKEVTMRLEIEGRMVANNWDVPMTLPDVSSAKDAAELDFDI